jgi:hypothetical protein
VVRSRDRSAFTAERQHVIRTQVKRTSAIILTTLVVAATIVATRTTALAAKDIASRRAKTTVVVEVHRPTVIVFMPSQWALDAKSDEGAVEEIAHVRFAVDDVNKCKGTTAIAVRMVFADRLALSLAGHRTVIDLSRKFPDSAGAYLLKLGKKPRALATPKDTAGLGDILSRAVGEFFDVPGCLHEG